jgi:DNA-binding MurR/RpiR family transcriptional regulator
MPNSEQETERGTIAEIIRQCYADLTTTERRPAQTLLGNYPFAGLETVAKFADRAGVSGPTISVRQPNFLENFGAAVSDNIRQTLESVHQSEFDAVVELLSDEKRPLYLLGGRFTGAVANYFYQHLHTLRPNAQLISGHESNWRNHLLDTSRRHVLVVFDIRRYQHDVIAFAEESAQRGATVVLFTDQWLSPISGIAKHMLTARVTVPSSWDSMIGMFLIVEALIARISEKMWPTAKSRVEELDLMLTLPERSNK